MLDILFDIIGDLFESAADAVADVDWSSLISEVLSDSLLIVGAISVASITQDAIREQMRNRSELKNKGVKSAVIKDYIEQAGYTEITLAALNAQNQQIGTFKMKAKSSSGVKKGMKISA